MSRSARFINGDFVVVVVVALVLVVSVQNGGNFTVAVEIFSMFGRLLACNFWIFMEMLGVVIWKDWPGAYLFETKLVIKLVIVSTFWAISTFYLSK